MFSHQSCSVDSIPEKGIGTQLLTICIELVKKHKIRRLDLSDNSTIRCNLCEPVLNQFYMLTRGETWYEKHQFRLDNQQQRFEHRMEKEKLRKIKTKSIPLLVILKNYEKKIHSYYKLADKPTLKDSYNKQLKELKTHKTDIKNIIIKEKDKSLIPTLKELAEISCCIIAWISDDLYKAIGLTNKFSYNFVRFFRYKKTLI